MKTQFLLCAAMLLALSTQAAASNARDQALVQLDTQAQEFVQATQYVEVDVDALTDDTYYSSRNFPGAFGAQSSASLPDASLDAIARSVLLLDAREAPLLHARYRIRYSMNGAPDFPEIQHDYVEVIRYNLGPALRDDIKQYVPANKLGGPAEFGIGPHVGWRFALSPVMGMQAGLLYASRTELTEAQARAADCLGERCLSLTEIQGPEYTWQPVVPPRFDKALYASQSDSSVARPARVIQELWATMSADGMDPLPYAPERPAFEVVVSQNVAGQEAAVIALARQAVVMDHSLAEIWTQRVQIAGGAPEFSVLYVPRR